MNARHQRFESGLDLADDWTFANLSSVGFRTYWGRQSGTYPEDFRRLVSEALERGATAAQHLSGPRRQ